MGNTGFKFPLIRIEFLCKLQFEYWNILQPENGDYEEN